MHYIHILSQPEQQGRWWDWGSSDMSDWECVKCLRCCFGDTWAHESWPAYLMMLAHTKCDSSCNVVVYFWPLLEGCTWLFNLRTVEKIWLNLLQKNPRCTICLNKHTCAHLMCFILIIAHELLWLRLIWTWFELMILVWLFVCNYVMWKSLKIWVVVLLWCRVKYADCQDLTSGSGNSCAFWFEVNYNMIFFLFLGVGWEGGGSNTKLYLSCLCPAWPPPVLFFKHCKLVVFWTIMGDVDWWLFKNFCEM